MDEHEFDAWNRDALINNGYSYANQAFLSSRLANQRITEEILSFINFNKKNN